MQTNQELHLLDYWRIINLRQYIVISFLTVVVGVVSVYSFVATPYYQSTAKLLVNMETNTTLTFEGGSTQVQIPDQAEYNNTQKKLLFSRSFVDTVVRKYGLNKNPYFLEKKNKRTYNLVASFKTFLSTLFPGTLPSPYEPIATKAKEELDPWVTSFIISGMHVEAGIDSTIMEIRFTADSPTMAASLANCIAQAYIEYNLDLRIMPYKNSVEWLTGRLAELKDKVEVSEKALQEYKEQKGIVLHQARESIVNQKLQGLVSQLVTMQGVRQEAEAKYHQIQGVINSPEQLSTVPDIMSNSVIQGLRNEELTLQMKMSDLSGKFGPKHPQLIKVKAELEGVRKYLMSEARKMLNSAKSQYEIALNREKFLNRSIEDARGEVLNLSREMVSFRGIADEAETNKRFYETLLKKLQEATLLSGMTVPNIQIIDSAMVSRSPIKPDRSRNILLSVVIGLVGGIFLAMFVDYMDDSLKNQDDVEKYLKQHYLGMVPSAPGQKVSLDHLSPMHESYRTIRMGLKFAASETPLNAVLITSALASEGKTTTASNLAVVLAEMGERVLLIDGDLRRPSVHSYFGLDNAVGLGSVIAEQVDLSSAIKQLENSNLSILTAGPNFPNPSELLSSDRMKEVLSVVREQYSRIIIDSPPIMPVSDPLILSALVDGVIMVSRGGVTSRLPVQKACQSLLNMKAHIIGVVLNNLKMSKRGYDYYYHYYSYYHPYTSTRKEKA